MRIARLAGAEMDDELKHVAARLVIDRIGLLGVGAAVPEARVELSAIVDDLGHCISALNGLSATALSLSDNNAEGLLTFEPEGSVH